MFNQIKGLLQFLPRTEDSWVSLQLKYVFEEWLGRNHSNGINNIYEVTSEELIK